MLAETYPLYLGNVPHTPNASLEVTNKYTGEVATRVAMADETLIDRADKMLYEAKNLGRNRVMPI